MARSILLLCIVFTCYLSATTLYKVVNKDGTVTYTDRPVKGAKEVDFKDLNSAVMPSMQSGRNTAQRNTKRVERALPDFELTMLSPGDGETIRDNQGNLNVSGQLQPAGSGEFLLFLNDQLKDTQNVPRFTLTNLDRGEHTVQIKFKHNSGKILASTQKQTVFLHRASALINSN